MKWCKKSFEEEIVDEIRNLIKNAKAQLINQEEAKTFLTNILLKVEVDLQKRETKTDHLQKEKPTINNVKIYKKPDINRSMEKTCEDGKITFIIPSVGRHSLMNTVVSLQTQTIDNWNAIVIYDGVIESAKIINENFDKRIEIINLEKPLGNRKASAHNHGTAGNVRNVGLNKVKTEWIGFVDDDDYLLPTYLQTLKEEAENCDLFIFRMESKSCGVVPNGNSIRVCNVGISFVVKNEFIKRYGIRFQQGNQEDGTFVLRCIECGAKYKISNNILYIAN